MHKLLLLLLCLPTPALAEPPLKTLIVIGDSLSEGYGVAKDACYPDLLAKKLVGWKVVNASISGSTSASAPSRMAWALKSKPEAVLLALGANDGLRGLKPEEMNKHLSAAIDLALKAGAKPLLAGMLAPPNYGKEYSKKFSATYSSIAKEKKVPLFPFLLKGVAGNTKLNLEDGIHPNEAGQRKIAENILPFLERELP